MLPNPLDLLRRLNHRNPYIDLILLEERGRLIEREEKLRGLGASSPSGSFSGSSGSGSDSGLGSAQVSEERYITQTIDLKRFKDSSGDHNILSIHKKGRLIEMVLVSDSKDYKVIIETDSFKLKRSYDELDEISDYIESINVFQDGSNYVLSLYDVKFTKFDFNILFNGEVTFSRIYAKWEELAG